MTIDQFKTRIRELEASLQQQIAVECETFRKQTGHAVASIDIAMVDVSTASGDGCRFVVGSVRVGVDL